MLFVLAFYLLYPGSRGGHLVEVELASVDELLQRHVAVVALNDFGLGLQGADNLVHLRQLVLRHLRCLVEQDDVAELYLLYDQVLNVLVVDVLPEQAAATAKLVAHAQCVDHGDDAVELQHAVGGVLLSQVGNVDNGLRNRSWLADAAGLDDDIVKAAHGHDVLQLLHQVHLQRAADAAVLQCHQRIVALAHDAALLDELSVDVHLANVVHDDGKLHALLVLQYAVQQGGLSAA